MMMAASKSKNLCGTLFFRKFYPKIFFCECEQNSPQFFLKLGHNRILEFFHGLFLGSSGGSWGVRCALN